MFDFKKVFFEKLDRRKMIKAGLSLPGLALLSFGAGAGCASSASAGNDEFTNAAGLTVRAASREFLNGESIELEADSCGWGWIMAGRNVAFAYFLWDGDNVVEIKDSSTVATTDAAATLSIFDNGTNVEIKNNLSTTLTLRYALYYSNQGLSGGAVAPAAAV